MPVKSVDMTIVQTVPCHIAGMGTLSCWKSPIDWHDMRVKNLIHKTLACKCASNYMYAKSYRVIQHSGRSYFSMNVV